MKSSLARLTLVVLGSEVIEFNAHADPLEYGCTGSAPANPIMTGSCPTNLVPRLFGTPFAGAFSIDFQLGDCESLLVVSLATNITSNDHNDWYLTGSCDTSTDPNLPNIETFCCVFVDGNGIVPPEVTGIAVRGLETSDLMTFTGFGTGFFQDTGMHTDLIGFMFGDGGEDQLSGFFGSMPAGGLPADITIRGGQDADEISGGNTSVTIFGDGGDDWILGSDQDDVINGGAGDDDIIGNEGSDTIHGNDGRDEVCGDYWHTCSVSGGSCLISNLSLWELTCTVNPIAVGGNDRIYLDAGGASSSYAYGGPGNDFIEASSTTGDTIEGGPDMDMLRVNGGDTANGGTHTDHICSDGGNNTMNGEDDNDILFAVSTASGTMDGGLGTDECHPQLGCEAGWTNGCLIPF